MASKKKIEIAPIADTVKSITEKAKTATNVTKEVAVHLLSKEKASIRHDVEDAAAWAEQRNREITNDKTKVSVDDMPTLAKVIFGGKDGIGLLSSEDQEKYKAYFKANGKRLALLTIINPAIGIGVAGIEMVSSGMVTKEVANASLVAGAGITTASAVVGGAASSAIFHATLSLSSGLFAVSGASIASALWPVGLSMLAVGAGAHIINIHENSVVGKQLEQVYADSQTCWKEAYDQFATNARVIEDILLNKLNSFMSAVEEVGKKAAISIDDAIHSDQNLRIMQYQEILLKQQSSIVEIRQLYNELAEQYNIQVQKNDVLARKLAAYEANRQFVACASEYLK